MFPFTHLLPSNPFIHRHRLVFFLSLILIGLFFVLLELGEVSENIRVDGGGDESPEIRGHVMGEVDDGGYGYKYEGGRGGVHGNNDDDLEANGWMDLFHEFVGKKMHGATSRAKQDVYPWKAEQQSSADDLGYGEDQDQDHDDGHNGYDGHDEFGDLRRHLRHQAKVITTHCTKNAGYWEGLYGRSNLRMARSYDGSGERLKTVLKRAMLGEELVLSAIGGSVTRGHNIYKSEIWFKAFTDWFNSFLPATSSAEIYKFGTLGGEGDDIEKGGEKTQFKHIAVNGAVPATGSDYFSFCHPLHIPNNSSLILVELSINDEYEHEHTENMENLLRSLLDLPQKPAVVLISALELNSAMMANGGDIHLPVAMYYDVPVISMRNPLAAHFMRHPELIHPYFTTNYWQDPDLRHISARGHRDMSNMVSSLVEDMTCELAEEILTTKRDPLAGLPMPSNSDQDAAKISVSLEDAEAFLEDPKQARPWGPWRPSKEKEKNETMQLGIWSTQEQHGQIPRLRYMQRWDTSTMNLPLEPQCFSTRSIEHPLTPTFAQGWYQWNHPDKPEKTYLFSNTTGSTFEFDIETRLGVIKMYSLRSKTFGLGSVECTIDGREDSRVRVDGYWHNGNANIGRFTTLATDLSVGQHVVQCQLLEETADPNGGHEFRVISLMSL